MVLIISATAWYPPPSLEGCAPTPDHFNVFPVLKLLSVRFGHIMSLCEISVDRKGTVINQECTGIIM